jgi:hypothetical protein
MVFFTYDQFDALVLAPIGSRGAAMVLLMQWGHHDGAAAMLATRSSTSNTAMSMAVWYWPTRLTSARTKATSETATGGASREGPVR